MMDRSLLVPMAIASALTGACVGESPQRVCTDELRVQFTPADTTIAVGQGFTASVQLATCGGAIALSDTFTWRSEDPSVATVDSLSGRVIGQSAGETRITATGERFGRVGGLRIFVGAPGS